MTSENEAPVADHEAEIARLTAERDAAIAGAVKVKPLVWCAVSPEDAISHDEWVASALGGAYHIAPDEDCASGGWLLQWTICHEHFCMEYGGAVTKHPSPDAAQAAAQADYEASIRAPLQPDPDARQADLAKAFCMGRDAALQEVKDLRGVTSMPDNDRAAAFDDCCDLLSGYIRALTPPADLAAKIGGE